jgi:predicted N-acetyltransferase YhbS
MRDEAASNCVVTIRPERPEDASRVRHVNEQTFGQPAEADLVEKLRQVCTDSLSGRACRMPLLW